MNGSVRKRIGALVLGCGAVLAVAAAAFGGPPEKEQVKFNAADQAAARAAVIRRADLGSASGWHGGMKKPDLSAGPTCPNYQPKQSDLVLTGAAEADFTNTGVEFDSEAQVLQTAQMVMLDWKRSVQAPGAVPCLRQILAKSAGSTAKLVSFGKIRFPRIARYAAAFLARVDVTTQGTTVPVSLEVVLVGHSRTEVTLTAIAPTAAWPSVSTATIRLARVLVGRAQA